MDNAVMTLGGIFSWEKGATRRWDGTHANAASQMDKDPCLGLVFSRSHDRRHGDPAWPSQRAGGEGIDASGLGEREMRSDLVPVIGV